MNVEKIRQDFPILQRKINGKQVVYLDNASTTQKPKAVIEILTKFFEMYNANIHRGMYTLSQESTHAYESAHTKVEKFIGAQPGEVVFTRNTTESLNALGYMLASRLKKGDEIVLSEMEHHSNLVPWQQLAKRTGAVLKWIPVEKNGELGDYEKLISDKTKLVTITAMSNALGTMIPIKEIGKVAHEHDALMIVDGAQSVPHMSTDVKKMNCDFLAFSGHKMCGPTGIGILYGKKEHLETLEPYLFGGDMIHNVTFANATWNDLPWKFEAGTPAIAEGIGLGIAVDYLKKIGMDNIFKHEQKLTKYAITELQKIDNVTVYGPKERGGIISFNPKGIHSHDVSELLNRDAICIRGGHHCCQPLMHKLNLSSTSRASFYFYNTEEEVDKLVESLKKIRGVFA